jgi:hypothetical protein
MIAFYAFSMLMLCAMAAAMAYTPALWGLTRLGRLNRMAIDTF